MDRLTESSAEPITKSTASHLTNCTRVRSYQFGEPYVALSICPVREKAHDCTHSSVLIIIKQNRSYLNRIEPKNKLNVRHCDYQYAQFFVRHLMGALNGFMLYRAPFILLAEKTTVGFRVYCETNVY